MKPSIQLKKKKIEIFTIFSYGINNGGLHVGTEKELVDLFGFK